MCSSSRHMPMIRKVWQNNLNKLMARGYNSNNFTHQIIGRRPWHGRAFSAQNKADIKQISRLKICTPYNPEYLPRKPHVFCHIYLKNGHKFFYLRKSAHFVVIKKSSNICLHFSGYNSIVCLCVL
jgi:hypothetical protein